MQILSLVWHQPHSTFSFGAESGRSVFELQLAKCKEQSSNVQKAAESHDRTIVGETIVAFGHAHINLILICPCPSKHNVEILRGKPVLMKRWCLLDDVARNLQQGKEVETSPRGETGECSNVQPGQCPYGDLYRSHSVVECDRVTPAVAASSLHIIN